MESTIEIVVTFVTHRLLEEDFPWDCYEDDGGFPIGDPKHTLRLGDEVIGLEQSGAWAHWVGQCNDCEVNVDCYRVQADQGWDNDPAVPGGYDPIFLSVCKPCLEARLMAFYLHQPRPGSYDEMAEYVSMWINCSRCNELCSPDEAVVRRGSAEVLCDACNEAM